jgi:hypothetical protein
MVVVGFDPEQRKQTPQNADSAVGFDAEERKKQKKHEPWRRSA